MNSEQPIPNNPDDQKTGQFLEQTIDGGSSIQPLDPEETHFSESGPIKDAPDIVVGRPNELLGEWIGPYQLMEVIGSGGMGTVYLAEQVEPVKRQVALKIIKAGMDTQQVIARFEAERQALSMMEHDNIARVLHASATEQGRPYFVMELVRGQSVTKFCDETCLSIEERLKLFICICDAVQHAHQKRIIHRDLKPSNILVSMQNGRPVPKIIDFGVAKATDQRLTDKTMHTQQGQVVGTLEYMSPEQANMTDADVDTRSDIYSLGVVLYELLTGNTPLNRQSLTSLGYLEILNRIKDVEAPKPSSRITSTANKLEDIAKARGVEPRRLSSQLRGDLDWIVLKSLEKDPERRYESAAGLADDVERYLSSEPITARPPTQWYLIGRFIKRHKTAVTAAAAVLLTLVGGIVVATSQAVRARAAEATVAEQMVAVQESYEREKMVASLEQQVESENQALMAAMSGDVRLKANFGQWSDVLSELDKFESKFNKLPADLHLIRLNALEGQGQYTRLKEEIVRLEKTEVNDQFRSELKLWRGYAFLQAGDGQTEPRLLIQQSIDGKLTLADRLFAEGLVTDSLPAAAEKFRLALVEKPQHSRARMQLAVTLILLGRYDDVHKQLDIAHALFPDDSRFDYVAGISDAIENKQSLTRKERRSFSKQFNRSSVYKLRVLRDLSTAVDSQFRLYDRDGLLDWTRVMRSGWPLFHRDSYGSIPVPEFQKEKIFNAYGSFVKSFLNPLMRLATNEKKHRFIIENCQTAWNTHPDGAFKCFEGGSWLLLGDYEKGAEALSVAAKADSLFPQVRIQATYGLFLALKLEFEQTQDRKLLLDAIESLELYLVDQFETHRGPIMFEAAVKAMRWDLAQRICKLAIANGGDQKQWMLQLIDAAKVNRNYGFALSVCDELLESDSDASAEIKLRRKEILTAISESMN